MEFSRKSIDKLGKRLTTEKKDDDLNLLQEYRKTFERPLQKVFSVISQINKKDCIFAFRIKRLDSIIRKLQRFENNSENRGNKMVLSNMIDIAGCRCIIENNDEKLQKRITEKFRKKLNICGERNWLKGKDSGYKALHLYIKQDGKKIEFQIRTKVQHNWATLVEIIDVLFDKKLKEGEKYGELNEFECLYSRVGSLTETEILRLVEIEQKYEIFKKMCEIFKSNYLSVRKQWLNGKSQRENHYFVITTTNIGGDIRTSIEGYKEFNAAENNYFKKFQEDLGANIVLIYTNICDFEKISMAYSNYFLAMHGFFDSYRNLLEFQIAKMCKQNSHKPLRLRLFDVYSNCIKLYIQMLLSEKDEVKSILNDRFISIRDKDEWFDKIQKRVEELRKQTDGFRRNIKSTMPKPSFWKRLTFALKEQLHLRINPSQKFSGSK